MTAVNNERPSIVETERGASVLYHGKYLYSKYNPPATIQRLISKTTFIEHSLIFVSSPVLGYGLAELLEQLPNTSAVLCVETDPILYDFSKKHIDTTLLADHRLSFVHSTHIGTILKHIESLSDYPFKKIIHIEGSAGSALNADFYRNLLNAADELIRIFWRNRMTLMHLGRNYARNIFSNLLYGSSYPKIQTHIPQGAVNKTVVVVGAGPSLDTSRALLKAHREKFYILAVDVALPALMPDIRPDAVVLVESQPWIDPAFIGFQSSGIHLFADCTASPRSVRVLGGTISLFLSDYTNAHFLERLKNSAVFNPVLEPLGTFGLSALQLALHLADTSQKVLHTGLDFSWKHGFTHAKGSSRQRRLHAETSKTAPLYSSAVIDGNSFSIEGKQGTPVRTLMNLQSYAQLYEQLFSHNPRVFDLDQDGLNYGSTYLPAQELLSVNHKENLKPIAHTLNTSINTDIKQFLHEEHKNLQEIKDILIGKRTASSEEIHMRLSQSDYLFTHFPDAVWGCSLSQDFLNRVRIEVEYFLKTLNRL